jgi:uncharacterized membrane-anchored protein YhcB (DUF1043 family)
MGINPVWLAFGVGVLIGLAIGVFVICLCVESKHCEGDWQKILKELNKGRNENA